MHHDTYQERPMLIARIKREVVRRKPTPSPCLPARPPASPLVTHTLTLSLALGCAQHAHDMTEAGFKDFLAPKLAKWWIPDKVLFTDQPLPLQGTGKVWKLKLRERYAAEVGKK
jgi:acyl-CoA synthetase (AMP-forming)/AMP-acid ligase II